MKKARTLRVFFMVMRPLTRYCRVLRRAQAAQDHGQPGIDAGLRSRCVAQQPPYCTAPEQTWVRFGSVWRCARCREPDQPAPESAMPQATGCGALWAA